MYNIKISPIVPINTPCVWKTDTLLDGDFEPYYRSFFASVENYVGGCFCRTPLKDCPVLRCALKQKQLCANVIIKGRSKNQVVCDVGSVDRFHDFSFYFIPTGDPTELKQELTNIRNNCSARQFSFDDEKTR